MVRRVKSPRFGYQGGYVRKVPKEFKSEKRWTGRRSTSSMTPDDFDCSRLSKALASMLWYSTNQELNGAKVWPSMAELIEFLRG